MKTSNQLLIGLIVIIFAAIFGAATVLKGEYEKIDKDDPYYGYVTDTLTDFSVVKMEGKYSGLIQIQAGEQFEVKSQKLMANSKVSEDTPRLTWQVQRDTLFLSYDAPDFPERFKATWTLNNKPSLYVLAPQLTSVHSQFFTYRLSSWDLPSLELIQQGQGSGMALTESSIGNLSATVTDGAMMRIEQPNQIKQATVVARDKSTFTARPSAIDSLSIEVDPEAQVTIPGKLVEQLLP
ncbi:hypothetical protein [Tunicatimonas pelagia]|uniref:hypothetical protein n=1 Tax=Tunicatimonas pelagia TaxID=931531 RepID=UPI002666915D|nr:hypothetical protein [Tunicatimonas pelagia]WKN44016.1 hypothetical protein P0M28_03395 [Tunicatimonas pelagia]